MSPLLSRSQETVLTALQQARLLFGYDRLVGKQAYRQLIELYRALRLYVNCFQPSMKLQAKQRDGKIVRYVCDLAKTTLQRLLLQRPV